ncbi:MAG: hypothetical protein NQU42_07190 [Methanothrix sp.]|uniref:hypothetical protein n=1 Tax=Methanothrix sp. TaxID=90426 RepID=UPI0025D027DA|nr:hypothetical protein [Methanothrix sp.]MCQ8903857.1 hypothetical protein [Methanothrix sp.]
MHPGSCGVTVMLTTGEALQFAGNLTLVVEDVDPQAGKVWLTLYSSESPVASSVLGIGEHFVYYGVKRIDLQVINIYAGGDRDLVVLDVIEGIMASPTGSFRNVNHEETEAAKKVRTPGFGSGEMLIALAAGLLASIWHS